MPLSLLWPSPTPGDRSLLRDPARLRRASVDEIVAAMRAAYMEAFAPYPFGDGAIEQFRRESDSEVPR